MSERRNTSNQHSRKKRRKKKSNPKKVLLGCLIAIFAISIIIFAVDNMIGNMFGAGEKIPENIKTAEEVKDDVVNILVCGLDYEEGRSGYMADVIVYVTMDVKGKTIKALQIPRDTYVGEPSVTGKINGVYQAGKEKDSIMNVIETINERFGLSVDHYVTLDMEAFIKIVDGIDKGLPMYVPYPVKTKDENGREHTVIAEPGTYNIGGETAEAIVRNRNYDGSDMQRLEVQGYFYAAVIKYFKELGISDTLKILPRYTPYITTDMHWSRMASIAATAMNINYEDMALIKPGVRGLIVGKQNILEIPQDEWLQIINDNFRPHQTPVEKLNIDPIKGEITKDYGQTPISVTNIGELLADAS